MERALRWWRWFQDKFLAPITALLFLCPIILAVIEVIRRYIFGVSWDWQQDIVTYFIISATYLFFATAQRQEAHLYVSLFINLLLEKGRIGNLIGHLLRLLAQLASLSFLGYFAVYGIKMTQNSYNSGRLVYSQIMPFWPFFLILSIGMGFMFISFFFQTYREIQAIAGKEVLKEEVEKAH